MTGLKGNFCLSCGKEEGMGRRKYCSSECRQRLQFQLNIRTGLLKALNTRYATFYFSRSRIIMDVLPNHSRLLFSFMLPRTPGMKPADDYVRLSNYLGDIWWKEKKRTEKRYLASRHVLNCAQKEPVCTGSIDPLEMIIPVVNGKNLACLDLKKSALTSDRAMEHIKSAYRRQAKRHHPDCGGEAKHFRKIHDAYLQLLEWSENPTFRRCRGFSDKWFYDGIQNRWMRPSPFGVLEKS
ncbi:MAG: DnaJ domain-containing protein [Desulfobacterales bacterium]